MRTESGNKFVIAGLLLAVAALTACAAGVPRPTPAPVSDTASANAHTGHAPPERAANARPTHVAADVRFMQHMIRHHSQALEMTALVPARTRRPDFLLLSERIEVSQRGEIALMTRWLQKHNAPVAAIGASGDHSQAGHDHMPGMLSQDELAGLGKASGAPFEQQFLTLMIRHHEGALVMVDQLFAAPGAAQNSEIFRFASDVDSDQRTEIRRMRALLAAAQSSQ
ncbi:MAG TPA: DUF305 domain-containing protein [Gemmatimonadaceae bacterium]|nr:DUF305 domain-containing protein [Gemmatimonadaceae bacterium]